MATVKFDHRVKYAKVWHPAHTVFDVEDKDVPELKKLGCQVLSYNEAPAQPSTPPLTTLLRTQTMRTRARLITARTRIPLQTSRKSF